VNKAHLPALPLFWTPTDVIQETVQGLPRVGGVQADTYRISGKWLADKHGTRKHPPLNRGPFTELGGT
jgi:hypothetical protein